jgi:hypothetical protein
LIRGRAVVLGVTISALAAGAAHAENLVTVRGQYYREPSTRVVQPVVEVAKDLPGGSDVRAHYLLDAITSASAASGPTGDNIFTEYRSEAGLSGGVTVDRMQFRLGYRYSAESDYWSHTLFGSALARLWGDSANLALLLGAGSDRVGKRALVGATNSCTPSVNRTCPLRTLFAGLWYSQILSPTFLAQLGYEAAYMSGYLSHPYRLEKLPDQRVRNAVAARAAQYFPTTATGLQLLYRFYFDFYPGDDPNWEGDPWGIRSHTFEGRVFQGIGRDVELRLTGRYYLQGAINIFCDPGDVGVRPGCSPTGAYSVGQPQLAKMNTVFVEAKVYWDARALRGMPFLGWFAEGTFELSYGTFIPSTSFGTAHVLQTGYALPF